VPLHPHPPHSRTLSRYFARFMTAMRVPSWRSKLSKNRGRPVQPFVAYATKGCTPIECHRGFIFPGDDRVNEQVEIAQSNLGAPQQLRRRTGVGPQTGATPVLQTCFQRSATSRCTRLGSGDESPEQAKPRPVAAVQTKKRRVTAFKPHVGIVSVAPVSRKCNQHRVTGR
jgi:hypothetical protein